MAKMNQRLQQKLKQKLSPQQIHLMKMLQMPVLDLEQRINKEIEENPVLEDLDDRSTLDDADDVDTSGENEEERVDDNADPDNEFSFEDYLNDEDDDIPAYKLYANNYSKDDERKEYQISSSETFLENLLSQVSMRNFSEKQKIIAKQLIGSIDEAGYITRELSALSDDLLFNENVEASVEEIEEVLHYIQQSDPPGIGARDLKECLLLQLQRMEKSAPVKTAMLVLERCLDDFTKKHYDSIMAKLKITEQQLKDAENIIVNLNPKPGDALVTMEQNANYVMPDFNVTLVDDKPVLSLHAKNSPDLHIKNSYVNMLKTYVSSNDKAKKEAADFIKQKIDSAQSFIEAIRQRRFTLNNTMEAIIKRQYDFFTTGDEIKLKPLILKDIAQDVGMDISTISRVVNSKYVSTPYGTYPLKFFFSESISTDSGEEVSNREVKIVLAKIVEEEDKSSPLTDEELMNVLSDKGYPIARRTIAKYREQIGIPVARLRRKI